MLPRRNRLSRNIFPYRKDKVFSWSGKSLNICAYEKKDKNTNEQSRFSFVVSAKKISSAVRRNRIKRIIFHALGEKRGYFTVLPHKSYVIFLKGSDLLVTEEDIATDIDEFLRKIAH